MKVEVSVFYSGVKINNSFFSGLFSKTLDISDDSEEFSDSELTNKGIGILYDFIIDRIKKIYNLPDDDFIITNFSILRAKEVSSND